MDSISGFLSNQETLDALLPYDLSPINTDLPLIRGQTILDALVQVKRGSAAYPMTEHTNRPSVDVAAVEPSGAISRDGVDGNDDESTSTLLNELLYCISSFHAIVTPVTITMILSSLAVVFINTDETRAEGEAVYAQTYEAVDLEEGNAAQNFAASVVNVLIMVSVVCVMTFLIVILYKYGCTKIFLGYMVVVMTMLLGYFTSSMALVAIKKYNFRVDKISFIYVVWNYTIVGVLAIFFNRGLPKFITQGYLVTSSVVLAWQLSYFHSWTAWTLLVILAIYDLFAVLSPFGPLRKLTELMSRPGARPLPGLLYEASLPSGIQRPRVSGTSTAETNNGSQQETENRQEPTQGVAINQTASSSLVHSSPLVRDRPSSTEIERQLGRQHPSASEPREFTTTQSQPESQLFHLPLRLQPQPLSDPSALSPRIHADDSGAESQVEVSTTQHDNVEGHRGTVALAIARLYKLDVIDEVGVLRQRGQRSFRRRYPADEIRQVEWTPKQLRAEVTVIFPHRGGRIVLSEAQDSSEGKKYLVYNRNGELLRTFVVNRRGQVLQVVRNRESSPQEDSSIKLGLGDFIFYSVLVSKAALQSYAAFICCMLTILCGLGGTLVLLAVHGKALPGA